MRAATVATHTYVVALPPRYHTLPAHLIETAVVLALALFVGWIVHRRGSRSTTAAMIAPAVYRCIPDDGAPLFEHTMASTTVGTAFVHDGRHYVIAARASIGGASAIRVRRVDRDSW